MLYQLELVHKGTKSWCKFSTLVVLSKLNKPEMAVSQSCHQRNQQNRWNHKEGVDPPWKILKWQGKEH